MSGTREYKLGKHKVIHEHFDPSVNQWWMEIVNNEEYSAEAGHFGLWDMISSYIYCATDYSHGYPEFKTSYNEMRKNLNQFLNIIHDDMEAGKIELNGDDTGFLMAAKNELWM